MLWWLSDDATLSDEIKDRLDREADAYVSPVSVWEVAIKQAMGKLGPPGLPEQIRDSEFRFLDVTVEHAIEAGRLPMRHRDPFDRMLVAQARVEGLTLVTRDAHVQKYEVDLLAA